MGHLGNARLVSLEFATAHPADLTVALLSERHASEIIIWLANLYCDYSILVFWILIKNWIF